MCTQSRRSAHDCPDGAPASGSRARGAAAGRRRAYFLHGPSGLICAAALLTVVCWSHGDVAEIAHAQAASATSVTASVESAFASALSQSRVLPWPLETVWPTAIRYLRVDRRYTIVDRDPDAGFVVFEFTLDPTGYDDDARKGSGSLELFATTDASGRPSAHVEVTVDGGPTHLPHTILDGLHTKLRDERGPPPSPPAKPPPPKGPKKPRGPDPDGPPDDPGQDPTPEPTPDPPAEPEPEPPKAKRRARPLSSRPSGPE